MKRTILICAVLVGLSSDVLGASPEIASPAALLRSAEERLTELRGRYKDKHPSVRAELARIEELRKWQNSEEEASPELAAARAELAGLQQRYKHRHPAIRSQQARIAELERNLVKQPPESAELIAARAELAALLQRYKEKHPSVQALRIHIAELEQKQKN